MERKFNKKMHPETYRKIIENTMPKWLQNTRQNWAWGVSRGHPKSLPGPLRGLQGTPGVSGVPGGAAQCRNPASGGAWEPFWSLFGAKLYSEAEFCVPDAAKTRKKTIQLYVKLKFEVRLRFCFDFWTDYVENRSPHIPENIEKSMVLMGFT